MNSLPANNRHVWLAYAVIITTLACLLSVSWMKWGSLMIDTFRDIRVCQMILKGKVIYRDFFYEYGIFPPYFVSLLCAVFGTHLYTIIGLGISLALINALLIFRISQYFLSVLESTFVSVVFLCVFAFGSYTYDGIFNFIHPYSVASVLVVVLTLATLLSFIRYVHSDQSKHLWLSSFFMTLVLMCRIDIPLLICLSFAPPIIMHSLSKPQPYRRIIPIMVIPFVAAGLIYLIFLWGTGSISMFRSVNIRFLTEGKAGPYILTVLGSKSSPRLMTTSLLYQLSAIALVTWGAVQVKRMTGKEQRKPVMAAIGSMIIILVLWFTFHFVRSVDLQYRCTPFLLMLMVLWLMYRLKKHPFHPYYISLLAVVLVSTTLTLRLFLSVSPVFVGFAFSSAALIPYYFFFFVMLREALLHRIGSLSSGLYTTVAMLYFIILASGYMERSLGEFKARDYLVTCEKGYVYTWNDTINQRISQTIDWINTHTPKNASLLALPQCTSLFYFCNRDMELYNWVYVPPVFDFFGEQQIINECRNAKIDYIVLLSADTSSYRKPSFGHHYARNLHKFITDNYTLVHQIGPYPFTSKEFGVAIFQIKK